MGRIWSRMLVGAAVLLVGRTAGFAETVRERLVKTVQETRVLMGKEEEAPAGAEAAGQIATIEEERVENTKKHFARKSELESYRESRPWSDAYDWRPEQKRFERGAVNGLTEKEAEELRKLLGDGDGEVRSLAVEALGALDFPEDVGRIGALLGDESAGAPALGWNMPLDSEGWPMEEKNPVIGGRSWHERKVRTYVEEALRLMTGHRFDGKDPAGVTFGEWLKTHDLGKESLWYWQERLLRESRVEVFAEPQVGEDLLTYRARWEAGSVAYRKGLHERSAAEIAKLPAEVQAKIYFLTRRSAWQVDVDGPMNEFFPEGMKVQLGANRLMELVAGKNMWGDAADMADGREILLSRMAMSARDLFKGAGDPPHYYGLIRERMEKEIGNVRWTGVLVSRLLPTAEEGRLDDVGTREGYLRRELLKADKGYERETVAAEMVREDVERQWRVLVKLFETDKAEMGGEWSDARIGVLRALGEEPHTGAKLQRLRELIEDPRNEGLFTQENLRMGMDQYRMWAVRGVNGFAGKEAADWKLLQDLGTKGKEKGALADLRRIAREMAAGFGGKRE